MKKLLVGVIAPLALGVGGYFTIHGLGVNARFTSHSSLPAVSAADQARVAATLVYIQNYAFSPASIRVKRGTTVTWTNRDGVDHTVTETDGRAGPHSGTIRPGSSYNFTFNTAGTYHYHCSIHPYMVGMVVVS